jgi:hypothetical protein
MRGAIMRKEALVIGLLAGIGISQLVMADEVGLTCIVCQGQALETPNQQRRRLGQPIVDSFPPIEYGQKLETPNQRRRRLGLPMPDQTPADVMGVAEETPNHMRQRLAATSQTN